MFGVLSGRQAAVTAGETAMWCVSLAGPERPSKDRVGVPLSASDLSRTVCLLGGAKWRRAGATIDRAAIPKVGWLSSRRPRKILPSTAEAGVVGCYILYVSRFVSFGPGLTQNGRV